MVKYKSLSSEEKLTYINQLCESISCMHTACANAKAQATLADFITSLKNCDPEDCETIERLVFTTYKALALSVPSGENERIRLQIKLAYLRLQQAHWDLT